SYGQVEAENWNTPKLIGKRYNAPVYYRGPLYLHTDSEWSNGTVYLSNGDSVANLFLKYNRLQDELIYYNQKNATSITLDKKQVSGFVLSVGLQRVHFKKISHTRSSTRSGYYEVLYKGNTNVLARRGSELKICPSYMSNSGIKKDRQYVISDRYLIAGKENELLPIRLKRKSLLLKFGEDKKKEVSRIIRRNNLSMKDEVSLIKAWKVLEAEGLKVVF
ncbi:MAG: hypothetical protein H7X84_07430, partial [Verrucomicrobia bacterium]|nr:hypothetical protein [Prolixibacteraceae bacterium]